MENNEFMKNSANYGGAIWMERILHFRSDDNYMRNITFKNNIARNGHGGALYFLDLNISQKMKFKDLKF